MDIIREALEISKLLGKSKLRWAFAGGVAVGIHGYIRATEDIDIILEEKDVGKLDILLGEKGYILHKNPIRFQDGFQLFRRVKIIDEEYFMLDILSPPENYGHLLDNRQAGFIQDAEVFVLSKTDLIKMKRATGRKIDLADVEHLTENES